MEIGKISESVLKRSVLRQIKTKNESVLGGAAVGADCAIFDVTSAGKLVTNLQEAVLCVEESCLAQDTTGAVRIGQLIQKCANNLAVEAATPIAMQVGLMLPVDFEEASLKELMRQASVAGETLGVDISGGQTFVTRAVVEPVAMITGYGIVPCDPKNILGKVTAGQDIVLSKWIGLEGTAYLAKKYKEELKTRYPGYLIEQAAGFDSYLSVLPEAQIALKSGVQSMHDASKGGIFATLWELAERAGVGLRIDMKKIPLRQETVEVCEFCNVNPYELMAGGCLVMTADNGENLVNALLEEGICAVVIGQTTDSKERVLLNEEEVRYMDRPKQDALYAKLAGK